MVEAFCQDKPCLSSVQRRRCLVIYYAFRPASNWVVLLLCALEHRQAGGCIGGWLWVVKNNLLGHEGIEDGNRGSLNSAASVALRGAEVAADLHLGKISSHICCRCHRLEPIFLVQMYIFFAVLFDQ